MAFAVCLVAGVAGGLAVIAAVCLAGSFSVWLVVAAGTTGLAAVGARVLVTVVAGGFFATVEGVVVFVRTAAAAVAVGAFCVTPPLSSDFNSAPRGLRGLRRVGLVRTVFGALDAPPSSFSSSTFPVLELNTTPCSRLDRHSLSPCPCSLKCLPCTDMYAPANSPISTGPFSRRTVASSSDSVPQHG